MVQESEVIDLGDITPIEVRYRINNEDYVLVEPTIEDAAAFRNWAIEGFEFKNGRVDKPKGIASIEYRLVARLLFKVLPQGERAPVSEEIIRRWPSRITKQLFEKAKEIGELSEKDNGGDKDPPESSDVNATTAS